MKKEIKTIDEKRGIVRCTTIDERYYAFQGEDKETGLPEFIFKPSVTYVTAFYPKGKFFEEWLRKNGQESELIKQLAGERGGKIHLACDWLIKGNVVAMDSKFVNNTSGIQEELTTDEYEAVLTFARWFREAKPKPVKSEFVVEGSDYAGTVDLLCEINGRPTLVDYKTGQYIYPSYELQLSAYKHAGLENCDLAILQLGYRKNKNGYKYTPVEDKYDLFRNVYSIFKNETDGERPRQIDLPLSISL